MQIFPSKKSSRTLGYSLIETLIYVALLTFLLISISYSTRLLFTAYQKTKVVRVVENSAITALDRIIRETRNATSVNTAQSSFGVAAGVLTVTGVSTTTKFYLSGGQIYIDENGAVLGALTSSRVKINSLIFRYIDTGISQGVRVEMNISSSSTPPVSANFYDSAVLRGSYN